MLSRRTLVAAGTPAALAIGWASSVAGGSRSHTSFALASTGPMALAVQAGESFDADDLHILAVAVQQALVGESATVSAGTSSRLQQRLGPVYVALRANGAPVASAWADGPTALRATTAAVQAAAVKAAMVSRDEDVRPQVTDAELCISHSYRLIDPIEEARGLLTNVHRGVLGIAIDYAGQISYYSPTLMLANNWSFDRVFEDVVDVHHLSVEQLERDADVFVFSGDQVLVSLTEPPEAVPMERGNRLVTMEEVTQPKVQELENLMGQWLTSALHEDGRMTYKYWPSRGEESTSNNMIRQWMATVALNRLAARDGDHALYENAAGNIRYNLQEFYREEGDLGLIEYAGKVKLGGVALAALALIEHPQRAEFSHEEAALRRTVEALWQEDGSFRTFYLPSDRNDNQNFYPGEALVLWATLYAQEQDTDLLERFMMSFEYYRAWHLDPENRNPAFVPWHTQAYYILWTETNDPALRNFIFQMNDWLLSMQEWDSATYGDTMGRFYDSSRPQYGPPHASSTGTYLEGLIDAYRLAVAVGDSGRADQYRLAIRRGLRSVMQLQFADDIDLYYISRRELALGGIRTTVYDNEIRVDNVQHNLLAVLKILETFTPADFTG